MQREIVRGRVEHFPGKNGWFYVPFGEELSAMLGPRVRRHWPALMKVECTLGETTWTASIMPIKDGPLFIALPAKVRKAESVDVRDRVEIAMNFPILADR